VVEYHAANGRWANGSAGVDLFFVISGLVMGLSSGSLSAPEFIRRRLVRLVPLYWALTLAKLAVGLALPATLAAAHPGPWNIAASFLFIPARDGAGQVRPVLGVGWTLQYEMLFYALFAVALARRQAPLRVVTPLLAPLAAFGFWAAPDWPAPLALCNGLVLEFCAGLALAHNRARLCRLPTRTAAMLGLAGAILLLSVPPAGRWRFVAWGAPAAAVVAAAIALEPRIGSRLPRWLLLAGDSSYAIYLLHPFLVPVLARVLSGAWLLAGALAASAAGGVWLYLSIDKPTQAWLRRRSTRPRPAQSEFVEQ
jgi:peptidoglycan/LPS O-acetylase OafA/YrhL